MLEKQKEVISDRTNNTIQYNTIQICNYTKEEIINIFRKFSKQVYDIYGFQKNSFFKIIEGNDRDTFILEVEGKRIGVLTFKTDLQNEDNVLEIKNGYLEIKSFFLFDGFGQGNIWLLWEKLIDVIEERFNNIDGVYVTISRTKAAPSLNMFKKVGFKELYGVYNEYSKDGAIEEHLYLSVNIENKINKFEIPIYKKYFEQIKNGEKIVEGRSGKSYLKYKKGDFIIFKSSGEKIEKEIKDIIRYDNLEDFLKNEGIENCLPGMKNIEDAINIYNNIPGYSEKIKKFGIVAFKF